MNKRRFEIALILSLAIHALFMLVIYIEPAFLMPARPKQTNTEIELVDANELLKKLAAQGDKGQIVDQSDKSANDETPDKAKFLSKNNQKVEKETQAELKDRFRNTTGNSGQPSPKQAAGEASQKQKPTLAQNDKDLKDAKKSAADKEEKVSEDVAQDQAEFLTDDESPIAGRKFKNFVPSFRPKPLPMGTQASGGGEGPSATDDHLKNVENGFQTMLNTREFKYYSYYNRIKDKLRQYWEPKIKEKMERVMRQGRQIASEQERITKCVIILDGRGTLVRVQVLSPSGLVDLDQAAVEAFQAAAPFPNPPRGIVEKDGYIRIRWDFILEASLARKNFLNYAMN